MVHPRLLLLYCFYDRNSDNVDSKLRKYQRILFRRLYMQCHKHLYNIHFQNSVRTILDLDSQFALQERV